jgi:hypothetical protein
VLGVEVAARRRPGLVDQGDRYAVIGIHAPAVLVEGVTEGSRELQEHERQVVLAAGTVPGPGAGAIFHHDVVGEVVEGRCVVSATGRVEYGLSAVKVGMVVILPPRLSEVPSRLRSARLPNASPALTIRRIGGHDHAAVCVSRDASR